MSTFAVLNCSRCRYSCFSKPLCKGICADKLRAQQFSKRAMVIRSIIWDQWIAAKVRLSEKLAAVAKPNFVQPLVNPLFLKAQWGWMDFLSHFLGFGKWEAAHFSSVIVNTSSENGVKTGGHPLIFAPYGRRYTRRDRRHGFVGATRFRRAHYPSGRDV